MKRLAVAVVIGCSAGATPQPPLGICADPNNLPFTNDHLEGFENELAALIGRDLGREVTYTWLPQRRGFIRKTLKAQNCDVVMGEPVGFDPARVTQPYYRSAYAFVSRADRGLDVRSLDDPRLRYLRIGIPAIGDDYANVPPALALARRGLADHIVGYSLYGDYSHRDPPRDLIDAVARGDVDVAIAWGPVAGYFAHDQPVPMVVTPIADDPGMAFAIGLGVRKGDADLARELDDVLARERAPIAALLDRYRVPRL